MVTLSSRPLANRAAQSDIVAVTNNKSALPGVEHQ